MTSSDRVTARRAAVGDLTVDNTSVVNGQSVNITGFTLNAPGE